MSRAAVFGGGPAGLMAAETLAGAGMAVTVYDHMPSVGRKFLLAGRGGLNITHTEPIEEFLGRYGERAGALAPAIRGFTPDDLRRWCLGLGQPTFVGSSGRVFPEAFRATPLLRAWLVRLGELGVHIESRHRWRSWTPAEHLVHRVEHIDRQGNLALLEVAADVSVFALGGGSWPRVGSTGGWVEEFTRLGIRVNPLRPANCGVLVSWSPRLLERFEGAPLKNVSVTVAGRAVRGEPVITRAGLEAGPIYAHSAAVREAIDRTGSCTLVVDLAPDRSEQALIEQLRRRKPKESMATALRRLAGLQPVAVALLAEVTARRLPIAPHELGRLVKAVPIVVTEQTAIDRAISTAGGVALEEVDDHFMLRRHPGIFVAGEMLDWEAPTGGYLLQASFSTAVAAAHGAVRLLAERPAAS